MSFIATISVSQSSYGEVEVTDTSDYSVEHHSAFINRALFLYKKDGTLLTINPQFGFTNYPANKIIIALKKDYCLKIVMVLTPTAALLGSRYSVTEVVALSYYAKEHTVQLALALSRNHNLRMDVNFYSQLQQYYVNLKMADLAAKNLQQSASQFWLDKMDQTSSIISLADQSTSVFQTRDQVISVYSFMATGNEGTDFTISALVGRKIMFFFRDDPRPLREVVSNPQAGQFTFLSSTGAIKTGVELQPGEYIQIQHTSQ